MSKLKQNKILAVAVEQGVLENEFNWKLVREHDGLTKESKEILWLEWNEDSSFKAKYSEPAVGRSLIMSPFNEFFTWQCTSITKIIEQNDTYIKFHTENSIYELFKIN